MIACCCLSSTLNMCFLETAIALDVDLTKVLNLISWCALPKILLQVEQSQAGLKSLSLSENTINQLRENFVSIEKYVRNVTDWNYFHLLEGVCSVMRVSLPPIFFTWNLLWFSDFLLYQVMSGMPNINWQPWSDKVTQQCKK